MGHYLWDSKCSKFFLGNSSKDIPRKYGFWTDISCTYRLHMLPGNARIGPPTIYKDGNHPLNKNIVSDHTENEC